MRTGFSPSYAREKKEDENMKISGFLHPEDLFGKLSFSSPSSTVLLPPFPSLQPSRATDGEGKQSSNCLHIREITDDKADSLRK